MAFDTTTRNKLARMVAGARTLLAEEFTGQLQEIYGIQPDGTVIDLIKLTHLDDEQRAACVMLRDRVKHLASTMTGEKKPLVAAIDRMIREQAFTLLNRFAALRMCEERKLIQESVGSGIQSKGFKVYLQIAGSGLGDTYARYKTYLLCLFDEIAIDLGVIFDRFSSLGLLFPREDALFGLLELFDDPEIQPLWAEDETIGWIYQYFNSQEERKQMRDASAAPRNSRELAVRNQFFTPRYVVEFLTDNTLGRIWYEMTQGETALKDECRYLVRRPNEIFLAEGEKAPEEETPTEELSQEELLQQPVYIPFRKLKDPRQLRMLDPACGSMHFGLYAFDLYEQIYEEAWEIEAEYGAVHFEREEGLQPLHECYADKEKFLIDIPRLIIEHNIHGVDIDPRAVQIAGLSLWLRAQRNWQQQRIKQDVRPAITRSNIVCAEPMPGDKGMLAEFSENLQPRVLGQLLEIVFEKMELAGEAGSLLKIEEEIADAVEEARQAFNKELQARKDGAGYLPGMAPEKRQASLFDFTDLKDETEFWEQAEEMIIAALQEYAGQAQDGSTNQRRLFARDAARGFAFIDLCRRRYDVVLMNPPFGNGCQRIETYLTSNYSDWNFNIFCCFTARALSIAGFVGAITDRAYVLKTSYSKYRKNNFVDSKRLSSIIDLGWNVLDANVEVNLQVFGNISKHSFFCNLMTSISKEKDLLNICTDFFSKMKIYHYTQNFKALPDNILSYELPRWQLNAIAAGQSITNQFAVAKSGLKPGRVEQFVRLSWEIPEYLRGYKKTWNYFQNGGPYSPFYQSTYLCVYFERWWNSIRSIPSSRITGLEDYWRPAISYGKRTDFIYGFPMPKGQIFSNEGMAVFPFSGEKWNLLAFINSSAVQNLSNSRTGLKRRNSVMY